MADIDSDITQLIESDHREVERLFQQLLTGDGDRAGLAHTLCTELKVHTEVEELVAYPAMRTVLGSEKIEEGIREHDEAAELIATLETLDIDDPAFESTLMQLQDAVQHHVEEEESQFLPTFRTNTSESRRADLGREWAQQKQLVTQVEEAESAPIVSGRATSDLAGATKQELYEKAKHADIPGRSKMTKDELVQALSEQA